MHSRSSVQAPMAPDQWVFRGLLVLLFCAPLPLGSNRLWAFAPLVSLSVFLLLGLIWVWRRDLSVIAERLGAFVVPVTLFGALSALPWLQIIPMPLAWLQAVSPETARVEQLADLASFTMSLDVTQTRIMGPLAFACFCAFLVTLICLRDRQRIEKLALTLIASGVFQSLVGAGLFSMGAHYWLFHSEVTHARVIGTYVYHNSLAGYLCMCLSIGVGLMLARLEPGKRTLPLDRRHRIVAALKFMLSPTMRMRLMLVIIVIALVLTRSRMGNAAFFVSMMLVGSFTILYARRTAPATIGLIASLVIIDVLIVGTWVGLEKVVTRVQETAMAVEGRGREETVEERTEAGRRAADVVADFPVLGTGGGSFYGTFFRYRAPGALYFDHAHNDYSEIAADYGLLGLGLMGSLAAVSLWRVLMVLKRRRSSMARGMAFGVAMSIVALLFHSTVDFNLQIPANALTISVILALGWAAHALPGGSRRRPQIDASPTNLSGA